jgi:hypothetical protein
MGFSDKLKNGIQNATSKTFEVVDDTAYNTKISGKKSDITKVETEIGGKVYELFKEETNEFTEDIVELCLKIKKLYEDIDDLEAEKKEKNEKAHAERQARRDSEE